MTSRPTNWVNCCSRCDRVDNSTSSWVQLSWVELCRYKHPFRCERVQGMLFDPLFMHKSGFTVQFVNVYFFVTCILACNNIATRIVWWLEPRPRPRPVISYRLPDPCRHGKGRFEVESREKKEFDPQGLNTVCARSIALIKSNVCGTWRIFGGWGALSLAPT